MSRGWRKVMRSITEGKDLFELYKGKKTRWEIFKLMLYINPLFDPIHNVLTFFRIQQERIDRLWHYGKHIWTIGEFDHNWHMKLQLVSLKRLRHILRNGHHVYNAQADRKMLTCIVLLERMTNDWEAYYEPADAAFQKKWGFTDSHQLFTHPTDKSRFYTSRHAFRDSLPEAKQKLYDKEYKELLFVEDRMFKQDMQLFCKLWSKNVQKWWD